MKKELHAEESRLMLSKVNRDAEWKYEEKAIIKGDSWRDCDILFLHDKLEGESELEAFYRAGQCYGNGCR